jgi:methionyl aminopeptidase
MNEDIYHNYCQAGDIAAKARDQGIKYIKKDNSLLEVATKIETIITENDAQIAFPVNLSINDVAAHYTPTYNDTTIFNQGDVVKLDVGAHINGYIADTATTIEIGTKTHEPMIQAASDALANAINQMRANISLSDIGKTVEETLKTAGYNPIENLTGHGLQQYELHTGLSVPNVAERFNRSRPQIDDVIAIEPFATNGSGRVISGSGSNIYLCINTKKSKFIRDQRIRYLYSRCSNNYKTLPFAGRWCKKLETNHTRYLKKMAYLGLLKHYPQLIEIDHGIVTQKEHTVLIHEEDCEVIT